MSYHILCHQDFLCQLKLSLKTGSRHDANCVFSSTGKVGTMTTLSFCLHTWNKSSKYYEWYAENDHDSQDETEATVITSCL